MLELLLFHKGKPYILRPTDVPKQGLSRALWVRLLGPLWCLSGTSPGHFWWSLWSFFGASWGAFCLVLLWGFSWTSLRLLWGPSRGLSGTSLGRFGVLSEAFAANCFMISLNPFGGFSEASLGRSGELSKAFPATRIVVSVHLFGVSLEPLWELFCAPFGASCAEPSEARLRAADACKMCLISVQIAQGS